MATNDVRRSATCRYCKRYSRACGRPHPLLDTGLALRVLRPAGYPDCTGNGVSARYDTLVVVGYKVDGTVKPMPAGSQVVTAGGSAVVIVPSRLPGAIPHLAPLTAVTAGRWCADGGNMARGDSRMGELLRDVYNMPPCTGTLHVHDRIGG